MQCSRLLGTDSTIDHFFIEGKKKDYLLRKVTGWHPELRKEAALREGLR